MDLKIGIIGTGIGLSHAKIASKLAGVTVTGICGYQSEKTQRIARELNIPLWTTDYKKLLEEPVDLVVIAPPNDLHFPMFLETLKHKKHIIVEKPAGITPAEVDKMIKASAHYNKTVIVDHELRFHPLFSKIRNMIQNGQLGNITLVEMSYTHNLFANPDYKFSWMNQKERGGGQLQLMGTHLLDLVNYWLDFPKATDISIKTAISVPERRDPDGKLHKVTAEDTFTLSLRLGNSLVSASNGTMGFGYKGLTFKIHGTKGFLIFDEETGLRASFEFGKMGPVTTQSLEVDLKEGIFRIGLEHFWEELIKLLTGGQSRNVDPGFCTLTQAKLVQKIIH